MTDRRIFRAAFTSARVLAGAGAAVVVVLGVVAAVAAPWPRLEAEPIRIDATPPAAAAEIACGGSLLVLGRTVEEAGALATVATPTLVAGTGEAVETSLEGDGGAGAFVVAPDGSSPGAFAAAESSSVDDDDVRGFAASACRPPLAESWLVGGATTLGANDLVILANPGQVAATVELTVYGASGPVVAPGAERVVPAGGQVVVPLAGLAPNEAEPVVRVRTTGAPVSASLQSSLIRTLLPGGVDQVAPAALPATTQVIPGVAVQQPSADAAAGPATTVRLLAPGADGEATVSVLDDEGRPVGEPSTIPLAADVPSALEIDGLDVGRYSVVVDAGVPVIAGAWSTTGFGEGDDFAWYAAAPDIEVTSTVAVARGAEPALTLVGGATDAAVVLRDEAGDEQEIAVPAAGVATVELDAGVYTMEPSAAVRAGVSYSGTGALAGYPLWGADAIAAALTVYP
jgi:hypothetical protein